jgi:hypothetical protein
MKNNDRDKLIESITTQIKIINNLKLHLDCDLYVCFEGEEEIKVLNKKQKKLELVKEQLIKIFSTLVGEF